MNLAAIVLLMTNPNLTLSLTTQVQMNLTTVMIAMNKKEEKDN